MKNEWKDRFRDKSIDTEAHIDLKDSFTFNDLMNNNYKLSGGIGIKINKFISDLMKCAVVVHQDGQMFIVKEYHAAKQIYVLKFLKQKTFKELLESINLGNYYKDGKIKQVNAWKVCNEGKNKNWIKKKGIAFFSENPNIFSFFKGYDYTELNQIDESKIQKYLNHIKEVIANNNSSICQAVVR